MIAGLLTVILLLCAFPVAVSAEPATATVSGSNVSELDVWDGTTANGFAGGSGSSTDPYQIATPGQLKLFEDLINHQNAIYKSCCFELTADIYLNNPADFGDPAVENTDLNKWTTVTGFAGTFDGNGHAIVGLYMYDKTKRKEDTNEGVFLGMFGNFGKGNKPTIQDLAVLDSVIYMPDTYFVGVLGWGEPYIYNCYVECDMTVAARSGIVQAWAGGIVQNTVATGTLTATNLGSRCGAFAEGYNAASSVRYTNCISLVKTNATRFGFVGEIGGTISNPQFSNCHMLQPNSENPIGTFAYKPTTDWGGELVDDYATLLTETKDFKDLTTGSWISDGEYLPLPEVFENSPFADDMRMMKQAELLSVEMKMLGASIRCVAPTPEYPNGSYGLRVATEVTLNDFTNAFGITEADFTTLDSFYNKYQNRIYFGTLFLPLDRLGETEQLTHKSKNIEDVEAKKVSWDGSKIVYTSVMTSFPQEEYNRAIVARSYVAFKVDPDSEEWSYSYYSYNYPYNEETYNGETYNEKSIIRTYMGVAAMAYENRAEESDTFIANLEAIFKDDLQSFGVKLNGVSLAKYRIVISANADINLLQTAAKLQRQLVEKCGKALPIVKSTTAGEEAIWLCESPNATLHEVTLSGKLSTALYGVDGTNIYLAAPHYYTLYSAVDGFCAALSPNMSSTFGGKMENVTDVALSWANNSAYTLVWNDEFNGTTLDTEKWSFGNNMDMGKYGVNNSTDSDVCRLDANGNLVMQTKDVTQDPENKQYKTNYSVTTHDTMNFSGGYLEMRAMVPFKGQGEWPSFWATSGDSVLFNKLYEVPNEIPSKQTNATTAKEVNGYAIEVDFFEVFSSTTELKCNIHRWYSDYVTVNYNVTPGASRHLDSSTGDYGQTSGVKGAKKYSLKDSFDANGYHTYGFLWTADKMEFFVDGVSYYTYNLTDHDDSIFNQTLTKRTNKDDSSMAQWQKDRYWNASVGDLTLDLEGFKPGNMALSVILTNQIFTLDYTTNTPYDDSLAVSDDSQFPITYTVDYVRLYQTTGDILYLPTEYGNGVEMFQSGRPIDVTKTVK